METDVHFPKSYILYNLACSISWEIFKINEVSWLAHSEEIFQNTYILIQIFSCILITLTIELPGLFQPIHPGGPCGPPCMFYILIRKLCILYVCVCISILSPNMYLKLISVKYCCHDNCLYESESRKTWEYFVHKKILNRFDDDLMIHLV